jgi:hypothetical protein
MHILAIDTSSAWCSVALSMADKAPLLRHEAVSSGASQLVLPWIDELLAEANIPLASIDAIAIDAFVRSPTKARSAASSILNSPIVLTYAGLTDLRICSSTSFAEAGIGVPGP